MALPEWFDIIKQGIAFHAPMKRQFPAFYYGAPNVSPFHGVTASGLITEPGMNHTTNCVAAMKEVNEDKVGLALDCARAGRLRALRALRARLRNTI